MFNTSLKWNDFSYLQCDRSVICQLLSYNEFHNMCKIKILFTKMCMWLHTVRKHILNGLTFSSTSFPRSIYNKESNHLYMCKDKGITETHWERGALGNSPALWLETILLVYRRVLSCWLWFYFLLVTLCRVLRQLSKSADVKRLFQDTFTHSNV